MSPTLHDAVVFAARCLRIHGDPCSIRKAHELDVHVLANVDDAQMLTCARIMLQSLPRLGTRYCAVREIIRVIRRAEVVDLNGVPEKCRAEVRRLMIEQDLTLSQALRELQQNNMLARYVNSAKMG